MYQKYEKSSYNTTQNSDVVSSFVILLTFEDSGGFIFPSVIGLFFRTISEVFIPTLVRLSIDCKTMVSLFIYVTSNSEQGGNRYSYSFRECEMYETSLTHRHPA
jgi:hypothetical protein